MTLREEVLPYREVLMQTINDVAFTIANVDMDELTDDVVQRALDYNLEWLDVYISVDEPEVLEKHVITCIKEYFYHVIDALNGYETMRKIDRIIFAGDYYNQERSTLHVHKIKTSSIRWDWDDYLWEEQTRGMRL